MPFYYYNLDTTDPAWNLAAEEYVFSKFPKKSTVFMLWQNDNAVIIGKNQNTLAEINSEYVRLNGVKVVRRLSGGGAVYHDLGNLNYTFIADEIEGGSLDFSAFCQPVVNTLAEFGVKAELSGRNDLTIDGRKFSGNSQFHRGGRVLHHGTILFSSDLQKVDAALRVDQDKIRSKGVSSVRSRVTTVLEHLKTPVSLQEFRDRLLVHVARENNGKKCEFIRDEILRIEEIKRERYDTWEWNYGTSPACEVLRQKRFEGCGKVECHLALDHGTVSDIFFFGDYFSLEDPKILTQALIGVKLEESAVKEALSGVPVSRCICGLSVEDLAGLLLS